jgi:hypothetical protein
MFQDHSTYRRVRGMSSKIHSEPWLIRNSKSIGWLYLPSRRGLHLEISDVLMGDYSKRLLAAAIHKKIRVYETASPATEPVRLSALPWKVIISCISVHHV